jgi:hypothetical protein
MEAKNIKNFIKLHLIKLTFLQKGAKGIKSKTFDTKYLKIVLLIKLSLSA